MLVSVPVNESNDNEVAERVSCVFEDTHRSHAQDNRNLLSRFSSSYLYRKISTGV